MTVGDFPAELLVANLCEKLHPKLGCDSSWNSGKLPRLKQPPESSKKFGGSGRYGCFRKWWYPQIIHINRVFHYFHHPFWGFPPIFWKHPYMSNQKNSWHILTVTCHTWMPGLNIQSYKPTNACIFSRLFHAEKFQNRLGGEFSVGFFLVPTNGGL